MKSDFRKDLIVVFVISIAYYLLHTNFVGIAAAIAFPEWFTSFAQQNKALSLVLFSLITTVPAAALAAVLAGYAIVKMLESHHILWGVVIVLGVTLYSALRLGLSSGFIGSLMTFIVPSNVTHVPNVLAWWVFLPLSIALLVWRSNTRTG